MTAARSRGSALVMVIWTIAVLSVIVMSFAVEAKLQASVNVFVRERAQLETLIDAGRVLGEMIVANHQNAAAYSEDEDLEELLDVLDLRKRRSHLPGQLSGGQQQRVAIARAIAYDPEILYFDEPTSALDPELTGEVLTVMRRLADEGRTMLVVTHEMDFARHVANRVVFMDAGVIVEQADAETFFTNPQQPRTREFLQNYKQRSFT